MTEPPFCRICFEADSTANLLSPCKCSGSQQHVHVHCLNIWLHTSPTPTQCPVCKSPYHLRRDFRLLRVMRRLCCGSTLLAYVVTGIGLLCLTPWILCVLGLGVGLLLCCYCFGYSPALMRVRSR